ncbi:hypothetical protein [Dyella mobilis]|uniref:Secreted protein n=1 Tax=Dyella mobilis TaxID=1849582 RepID=A0ABS2KHY1_9GAMM|nr:hypothetical protein [Dyella mobilis]MBM7130549.1 hypothetical protein [Dyella mobilis]GLQ97176.1 hypothetical protein GCM10007863_15960 [Dyella mobilis]
MKRRAITALATSLLITAAWAQTASQPLNLKLPPNSSNSLPAASTSSAAPAHAASSQPNPSAITVNGARPAASPGVYYGDTSGKRGNERTAGVPTCDDSTFNKPQVHGDVGMGVVSASHFGTGSYQSGAVSVTQNTGSCDHPTGSVGVSIGVSRFGGLNGH